VYERMGSEGTYSETRVNVGSDPHLGLHSAKTISNVFCRFSLNGSSAELTV